VHTLDDSPDTVRLTPAFGDPDAAWRARNDAGLTLAIEGRWPEALEAFSDALANAPCFADAPDVHALLNGNRAQAHFHCGELQLAVESARRALAARLVCGDESDAPVARMRADLGVYLAACGDVAEAERSLHEARLSLESRFGEDDLRLVSVLENQARVQLMAHRAEVAEPLLLRAHALLGERHLATDSLTPLFGAVQHARASVLGADVVEVAAEDSPTADLSENYDVFPLTANASANSDPALAMSAAPDREEPADDDVVLFHAIEDSFDSSPLPDDAFELIDADDYPPMRTPSPDAIRSAGLVEPGAHATPQEAMKRTHPLGFEIQYGIPQEQLLHGDTA